MILAHKIRLYPNKEQEILLNKSCGVARFAYNWGLEEWNKQYKDGKKPNYVSVNNYFNSIKKQQFPFVMEVSKCCAQEAIRNLRKAFTNFFRKRAKFPTFKKKGANDSFYLENTVIRFENNNAFLPKMKPVKMAEQLRFNGKIMGCVVSKVSNKWFISVSVEVENTEELQKTGKYVGIDLGIKDIAITSDGMKFSNPKWINRSEKKMKRLNREFSRRKKGSKRREKTRLRLERQHNRVSNQRKDYLNKITTYLVKSYDLICLEDLNVRGMVKNHNLAKAITNVSFGEFRRQIEYKTQLYGKRVYFVDRFFPSSKTCSSCGCIQEKMPLNIREWTCPDCGAHHDRDLNAATNLLRRATSEFTHGEKPALVKEPTSVSEICSITKLDSMNRELRCC